MGIANGKYLGDAGSVAIGERDAGLPARRFRLIRDGAAPGAWNMAVDEAIARAVAAGEAPPTLRFYAWEPPCVSLGRSQPLASLDRVRCEALGYDIVRRPTGGRAILHTDELTYSICAPAGHPLMGGMVLDAYLRIAGALVSGLRRLGVEAEEAPGGNRAGPDVSAACFEVPSAYEIVARGRKLLGSAQSRGSGFVLQHGSLPLTGKLTRLVDALAFTDDGDRNRLRSSLADHAATLEELSGRVYDADEAAGALEEGFREALSLALEPAPLSATEAEKARELAQTKYGADEWTGLR